VHVRADLAEDDQGGAFCEACDKRQVDTGQARERGTRIEAGGVGLVVAAGLGGQGLAGTLIVTGRARRWDRLIAWGHLLVIAGIECHGLLEGKEVLGAPGALQGLGDVLLIMGAVGVAPLRQALRVTRAREDGREESHAGHAGEVTDDLGEREVHLCQGLGPMLHMVGGVGQEPLPVTERAAQPAHVGLGPQGTREEPVGLQTLQPLASEAIGCRSAGDPLGLAGIHQEPLEAPGLQERKQRQPGDPGRCHGDGGHATVHKPVGEGVEVGGARAKTAPGLRGAPRGHRAPVLGFADVDASGMGVADLECVGEHG
jgi:hypothetical protein